MLTPESTLSPNEAEVAAKVMDGEAVLINITTGMYHSSNGVGGAIWPLIERGHSLAQIAEVVTSSYDVPADRAAADIQALAERLLVESLVLVGEHAAPPLGPIDVSGKLPYETPTLDSFRDMSDLLALDPPMPGLQEIPWEDPQNGSS